MKLNEKTIEILKDDYVCDHCLGRVSANLLSGLTNEERGRILRQYLAMEIDSGEELEVETSNFHGIKFHNAKLKPKKPGKCSICGDIFPELKKKAKLIAKEMEKYEYKTFLIGCMPTAALLEKEQGFWSKVGIEWCEPIKSEINRVLGKEVEKITGKSMDRLNPDINAIYDLKKDGVELIVRSVFIYGKYQKLVRNMPQTTWKTRIYPVSVQDIIAKPFMKQTRAEVHRLHGCVGPNTQILTKNGFYRTISDLKDSWKEEKILCFDSKKNEIVPSGLVDFFKLNPKDGSLEVFEIKTEETGRNLTVTSDHPFHTPKGMLPLSDLRVGSKVAVYPYLMTLNEKKGCSKIILSEEHIIKTIEKFIPTAYKSKIIKELKERDLLLLTEKSSDIFTLTKLIGFLFGDGSAWKVRKSSGVLAFYGKKEDLLRIQSDIKDLGFNSNIRTRKGVRSSIIKDYYGNRGEIKVGICSELRCDSNSLWALLVSLGVPVGNKTINEFKIPIWIKDSNKQIKKDFLSALFGSDMDKPRLDKRRHNKKSFNTPRFSINKSENTLKNGKDYIQEIVGLLEEFGIETLKPRIIPYTTRKDGNKTLKICLDFSNRFENLIKLYGKIGYVYCKEREILSKHVLEYLLMKKYIVDMRKESYKKSLKMTRNGIKPMEIYKKIGGKYLSYKNIAMWVEKTNHTFNKIKIPNNFPNFDGWLKGASKGLGDGLVWETIFSIKKVNAENLFDLTTQSSAHTFFSNGFLVSNSGREDVDVRCLGWRPFVLELMKPKKRSVNLNQGLKAINKSKKAQVKDLKLSDKRTVTRIKSIKPDKTYQAEVVFESPVKGLEKLEILQDIVINQETPLRVATRRADKLRRRRVKDIKYKLLNKKKLEMTITAQSGTYIKELIHGDEGRTRPNVADLISNKVKSIKLDVIKIHCD